MVIAKTPLRIPFAGGLSDLKPFASIHGGATVSATINKYVYVAIKESHDGFFNLQYANVHEKTTTVDSINNGIVRESLKLCGFDGFPLDIQIMADLDFESGLGSSGALLVAILKALHFIKGGGETSDRQLIDEASYIEVEALENAGGYHDHSICALGGLRHIVYKKGYVSDTLLVRDVEDAHDISRYLMLFYTGYHAKTKPSLDVLTSRISEAASTLGEMKNIADQMARSFYRRAYDEIGPLIDRNQELKQTLPGNFYAKSTASILDVVRESGGHGLIPGGKVGAYLLVWAPGEHEQQRIESRLESLKRVSIEISNRGASVVVI